MVRIWWQIGDTCRFEGGVDLTFGTCIWALQLPSQQQHYPVLQLAWRLWSSICHWAFAIVAQIKVARHNATLSNGGSHCAAQLWKGTSVLTVSSSLKVSRTPAQWLHLEQANACRPPHAFVPATSGWPCKIHTSCKGGHCNHRSVPLLIGTLLLFCILLLNCVCMCVCCMNGFMHCRWVLDAGGSVTAPEGIEVSPLISYGGEDLAELCSGKTFKQCLDNSLQVCHISDSFAEACAAQPCLLYQDHQPVSRSACDSTVSR